MTRVVYVIGSVPSTGASTQAMTSYLPEEIKWGHRFERLVTNQREDGKYLFDYTQFNNTVPVDTPPLSGEDLHKALIEQLEENGHDTSNETVV